MQLYHQLSGRARRDGNPANVYFQSFYLKPEVIKQITIEKTVEMMEGFGSSDEVIDATIEGVEKGIDDSTTPMGLIKSSPWGLLFLALL